MDIKDPPHRPPTAGWTQIDGYMTTLRRRRMAARRRFGSESRTEPEAPALLLSILPFVALAAALAVLAASIIMMAWPG